MMRLFGFYTQNTRKALYAVEAVGVDFEFRFVDLSKGEQRSDDFLAKYPVGKVPVLQHGDLHLFESGAIARYVGNVAESPLYPQEAASRARVDQWLDYFVCHPGRWLTSLYFNTVIRPKFGLGEASDEELAEAAKFAAQSAKVLDRHLADNDWLTGASPSIADWCGLAYIEQERDIDYDFDLEPYANLMRWYRRMADDPLVARANARLEAAVAA